MPFDILGPTLGLADTAHASLVTLFQQIDHRPSKAQWDAILDLLDCLECAADKSLDPRALYVSAIPAGTGKSASLAAFAKALMDAPHYARTGMLITCNRVSEVRDMAAALADHRGKLCIMVGKANLEVLAMGDHQEADQAQVVIATQAAIKETLRTALSFDHARRFFFHGGRRDVVSWDEAFNFARPVVVDAAAVASLATAIARQSEEAAPALLEWAAKTLRAPTGNCEVPDFATYGIDFHRLEEETSDRDDLATCARALGVISGGTGWVMRNGKGSSLVSQVPEIPISMMPVVVTDASAAVGVHHASYAQMARSRRIVRLKEADKTYRNMTIRLVNTAASRSTYRDKDSTAGKELIEMAVRYIRSAAPDKVLVIGYKTRMVMKGVEERTIKAAIEARLTPDERGRFSYLHYGNHTATNEHKDTRRVLLMGLNFLAPAASYAASGAALDKPMRTSDPSDHPTEEDVADMRLGMLRDATLQAILRGHARKAIDGDCGTMEVVIPQSRQTGLSDEDYRGMFPDVTLTGDRLLMPAKPLKGKLKALSEIVTRRLNEGEREISNPTLAKELGMAQPNFSALVKKPEWQAWVAAMGLQPGPLKGRVMGLRRIA